MREAGKGEAINQTNVMGPNRAATLAVPRAWTENRPMMMASVSGNT